MAGYIRKRGKGSWEITVRLGRDPVTGRLRRRFLTVRGTKRDAERALTEALHQRDTGTDIVPARITLAEYLETWLRDYAAHNVAPSTLARYTGIIRRHLIPALGDLRLRDIRPAHIQAAYGRYSMQGGRADGRPGALAPRTILQHHRVLREALHHAIQWQLISVNPADSVKPPHPQRQEMQVLSLDECVKLLELAETGPYHALIYMALSTGARIGELLALRWRDIDFDAEVMRITRTSYRLSGHGIVFSAPKTPRAVRPVALSPDTLAILRQHRRTQVETRLAVGPMYEDHDLVFAWATGNPLDRGAVRRAFARLLARAGLPHVRLHDLRHSAGTLMLAAGVNPKVVSERLGHATVAITLDVYSHVLPELQREAAVAMDRLLGKHSARPASEG